MHGHMNIKRIEWNGTDIISGKILYLLKMFFFDNYSVVNVIFHT